MVMVVSRWSAAAVAEVSLVSTSPRYSSLCAKKFALLGPVRTRARKSSPCKPKTAEKRCLQACRASFFADKPLEGLRWASLFAKTPLEGVRRAKFFAGLHKRPRAGRI